MIIIIIVLQNKKARKKDTEVTSTAIVLEKTKTEEDVGVFERSQEIPEKARFQQR